MAAQSTLESSLSPTPGTVDGTIEDALIDTNVSSRRLPAVLGTRDLTALFILIVLLLSSLNRVQVVGPAAFTYWGFGIVCFFLPSILALRWVAHRFPGQGALYQWSARIFGPNSRFLIAFCCWWAGILCAVQTIEQIITCVQYFAPTWFAHPIEQVGIIFLIVGVTSAIACVPMNRLKHLLVTFATLYVLIYVLLGLAGIWWIAGGHHTAAAFNIPARWYMSTDTFTVYAWVVASLLRFNAPLLMVKELRSGTARSTHHLWWGSGIVLFAYLLGTFGIITIVPSGQAGSLLATPYAIASAFGPGVGLIADIVLIGSQGAIIVAILIVYARLAMIVAENKRLPNFFLRVNRSGVPVAIIVAQAGVILVLMLLMYVTVPEFIASIADPATSTLGTYNTLAADISVPGLIAVALIFFIMFWYVFRSGLSAWATIRKHWLLLGMSLPGTFYTIIGCWRTASHSWIPQNIRDDQWPICIYSFIIGSLIIAWLFNEFPRLHALIREQKRVNEQESRLREQLQEAYEQQKALLDEVDRLYREQAQAAVTDAITGLPNHRAIIARIEEEIADCQREGRCCAVLFVDLDRFKNINDTWGHRAGDAILREIAHRLRATLRAEDFVGRYGGEEFALVLPGAEIEGAYQIAERLRNAIAFKPCSWLSEDTQSFSAIPVTGSIGVAVFQLHGITRESLIEYADRAMYRAKQMGRNCVCIADVTMDMPAPADADYSDTVKQSSEAAAVQALTAAAFAHDRKTDEHAHRMVWFAEATAHKLGRPYDEIRLLRLAALVHDIGKIGIPDAILHKAGPLTAEEWEVMRRHPDIGRKILERAGGVLQHLAHIVVAHHERWDGQGYPASLAREAIPMSARILAVVDSYDAMTSRRVYRKKSFTIEEATAELQRCAGSQFDPHVVEAFLVVLNEHLAEERIHLQEPLQTAIP